jgi:hypothetical protein
MLFIDVENTDKFKPYILKYYMVMIFIRYVLTLSSSLLPITWLLGVASSRAAESKKKTPRQRRRVSRDRSISSASILCVVVQDTVRAASCLERPRTLVPCRDRPQAGNQIRMGIACLPHVCYVYPGTSTPTVCGCEPSGRQS